jgi:hypothetical protein
MAFLLLPPGRGVAAESQTPVHAEIMIVGVVHLSNPHHDLHNNSFDDVLSAKRQGEIDAVNQALARFNPTLVAAEWSRESVEDRYAKYVAGSLPPSRNEVVQLGFRLAKQTGARMIGIDADGEFPYEPVEKYAAAHGQSALTESADALIVRDVQQTQTLIDTNSIGAVLRFLNDPAHIKDSNGSYRLLLQVGEGEDQPGANLLAAWYQRNFVICARLLQAIKSGDRVTVFYGAGHSFLLRQCIQETPGLKVIEANDYLPR